MMPFRGPSETPTRAPPASSDQEDILNSFDLHLLDECLSGTREGLSPSSYGVQFPEALLGDRIFSSDSCDWMPCSDPNPSFGCQSDNSHISAQYPSNPSEWDLHGTSNSGFPSPAAGNVECEEEAHPRVAKRIILPRWVQCRAEGRQPAYEWPPQSDPELERKRRRAVRAFKNRQRASEKELAMQEQIVYMASVINKLQAEKKALEEKVSLLQAQLATLQPANMNRYQAG